MKVVAISLRMNRTSIAKAPQPRAAAIVRTVIGHMGETVVGGVDVRVADAIVDAAGAVDVLVVVDGIAAAAAGGDTRNLPRICADSHG